MTIKAIIWDLEGVILCTKEGSVPAALARVLDLPEESIKPVIGDEFDRRVNLGEFTQDEYWDYIIEKTGRPKTYKRKLENFLLQDMFIDQEILADIHRYHKYLKTCLLSNFSSDLRALIEDHWGIANAFDKILISGEIGMIKPQPEAFRKALDALGCQPGEAVFVDDRLENVEGAQAVGLQAIHYQGRSDMNKRIMSFMDQHQNCRRQIQTTFTE